MFGGHDKRYDGHHSYPLSFIISLFPPSVVVDRKNDAKADTGGFELIYKQQIPPSPAYMGLNLFLKGQQITQKSVNNACGGVKRDKFNKDDHRQNNNNLKQIVSRNLSSGVVGHGNEKQRKVPVIMDLIDCLDVKHAKRQVGRSSGQTMMTRTGQGYLKSRNKVDVDYKEKSNAARRHHSCGPVMRQQSTMKCNTPRVEDATAAADEPFIVPVQQITQKHQQVVGQGDSIAIRSLGNRVDQKEDVVLSLPPVINNSVCSSSRKTTSSDGVVVRLRASPKGKIGV